VFTGTVSLEYNGVFFPELFFNPIETNNNNKFMIRVKGDGKSYQFRVKPQTN